MVEKDPAWFWNHPFRRWILKKLFCEVDWIRRGTVVGRWKQNSKTPGSTNSEDFLTSWVIVSFPVILQNYVENVSLKSHNQHSTSLVCARSVLQNWWTKMSDSFPCLCAQNPACNTFLLHMYPLPTKHGPTAASQFRIDVPDIADQPRINPCH